MEQKIITSIPDFTLRFAADDDTALVLSFIKKLAEYEKLSHAVVTDEATLHHYLFGERRVAEVLIGDYQGQPVAFALFFHNFSTFLDRPGLYLEDLFVDPAMRGRGFGRVILTYLARLAVERGCGRLEWWVLDWNESAIKFYQKLGAAAMDEWTVYRLTGEALVKLAQTTGEA
jgi:GNAT superfamily N-acetyltransferase